MIFIPISLAVILIVVLTISYVCFRRVFYSAPRKPLGKDEYDLPKGEVYKPFHEGMIKWIKETRSLPHEDVEITSRDGLTLRGKYYEYKKGAPVEIMLHGYLGHIERDLCGGAQRAFALGRNALLVNQRAAGTSDGSVITFGIKERHDCIDWAKYVCDRFGENTPIYLTGISMGASTVMMAAADEELPKNVSFVLADCGFTSAREIIGKILTEMKLPPKLVYPFIKLGARIYGGFSLDETSAIEAVKKARVPVIFIHGDSDDFVPFSMSERLYDACITKKELVAIEGAAHGVSYPTDKERYVEALRDFEQKCKSDL